MFVLTHVFIQVSKRIKNSIWTIDELEISYPRIHWGKGLYISIHTDGICNGLPKEDQKEHIDQIKCLHSINGSQYGLSWHKLDGRVSKECYITTCYLLIPFPYYRVETKQQTAKIKMTFTKKIQKTDVVQNASNMRLWLENITANTTRLTS